MSDGFRNLTDSQLKQTIGQLQYAATSSYISPIPQQATTATYQKNLQAWSSTPTPPPRNASAGTRPSRARNTRPSNFTNTSTPAPANASLAALNTYRVPQEAAPPQQSISRPPPVPTTLQAFQSTYASRLRTGATLLMQPILASAPVTSSSAYPTTITASTRSSRRTGTIVNYADPGSGDEFPDAGEIETDDSDFVASGGTRTSIRQSRGGRNTSVFSGQGATTQGSGVQTQPETLDQSYLGMIPPDRFIKTRFMLPTPHEYPSEEILNRQSLRPTALVPIRVEFDTDTHRIRDCFVWNIRDDTIKPEQFAKIFCNDLDLPQQWVETVANQIKAQLEDCEGVATMELGMDGAVDLDAQAEDISLTDENDVEVQEDEANMIPECRVILSIDVQIATYHLLDHIEWDLLSPLTPESFAITLCQELGLSGEAIPLVAHAVHEELIKHKKDAVEWGVIAGSNTTDRDSRHTPSTSEPVKRDKSGAGLMKDKTGLGLAWGRAPKDGRGPKPLRSVWRDWAEAEEFRTRFEELSQEEVERREMERERAARRLRRETSKFQSNLLGLGGPRYRSSRR
ncbi:SNF5-domain-containing protein [Marasmius fiardii PR-910]|nr:SNF5-domain-containing protein [Marasmius fiardii PR-910]